MAYAQTDDGVRLYYETAGSGAPLVFVHEFGGDYRSWDQQIRYFSRRYRCVVYSARGYPPSDVPAELDRYSQARAVEDIRTILDHLEIERAHIVGLSMGAFATLHFGLTHPGRALSLVMAGLGFGAEKHIQEAFRRNCEQTAQSFLDLGIEAFAPVYGLGASRVQLQNKNPRGWQEFVDHLAQHSTLGSANTMRGVQGRRPSIYDLADRIAAIRLPSLIMVGDEDDQCLQPGIFLKRTIPTSGLVMLAKTGHAINLEEPALFNFHLADFLSLVEAGKWGARDPRANPAEIMPVAKK